MKRLVVGANIEALRYSFEHDIPLVYLNIRPPHRFTGYREEWHHLYFALSLAGKIKFADKVSQIRIDGEDLRITVGHHVHEMRDTTFYVFDADSIENFPPPVSGDTLNEVLDWIDVRSGMKHKFDVIHIYHNFIKSINFYPSDRIDGNRHLKDACVVSYMTDEQLDDFNCSELITRFKAEEIMKQAGIKGAGNGVGRYLPIRLESRNREVFPLKPKTYLNLPPTIEIITKQKGYRYPASKNDYLNYLLESVDYDRER